MKILVQRVSEASVSVDSEIISSIGEGACVFVGFDPQDNDETLERGAQKLMSYKIFNDERDRIGLSIEELECEVLIIPQVTLSVNTNKGSKPSFSNAAKPSSGLNLFNKFSKIMLQKNKSTFFGIFGARDQCQRLLQASASNCPSKMGDLDAYVSSYGHFRRF